MDVLTQIAFIIDEFEGGNDEKVRAGSSFSDDPDDHGGATRWGICRALLSEYLGLKDGALCPVERVRDLTRDEAIHVGAEMFALRTGLYRIVDDRLRFAALDFAFHSGSPRAVMELQRVLGMAEVTGNFGPHTEAAVNGAGDAERRREQLIARRLDFVGKDLARHPDQAKWAHGWLVRVGKVLCYQVN